jgi:hypothetical protein
MALNAMSNGADFPGSTSASAVRLRWAESVSFPLVGLVLCADGSQNIIDCKIGNLLPQTLTSSEVGPEMYPGENPTQRRFFVGSQEGRE